MPQQALLPQEKPPYRIVVEIEDSTLRMDNALEVAIRLQWPDKPPTTVWKSRLIEREADYLNTLVTEVVSAFMYESGWQSVPRAAATVAKQARAHRRTGSRA